MKTHSSTPGIRFHVDPIFLKEVQELPWQYPISEWRSHGVRLLDVKRGILHHVVIFVKAGRFSFGIKEIAEENLGRHRRDVSGASLERSKGSPFGGAG